MPVQSSFIWRVNASTIRGTEKTWGVCACHTMLRSGLDSITVSYTHLDVYKRQEFLGCNFECVPVEGIAFDTNVKVEVDFEKVILQDNEEDGTLTGEVKFILYKGDHYHLTVLSDWDENVFVDTNDVWDDGDRVGITIPPDAIRIVKITD